MKFSQAAMNCSKKRPGARVIQAAVFDAERYQTILQLKGASAPVEIAL